MAASLGSTAARGALMTLGGQGGRILLQFLGIVVLARLLDPEDYGLLAVVTVIIGVGEIFRDFGLSSAAVRAKTLSHGESSNLFWINSGIGALLGLILIAISPLVADAVGREEVQGIAQAMSLVFLLNGLATQFRAHLMRSLRFRQLATVDVCAPALALAVAVGGALLGWGYWALVAQQITQALVVLVGAALVGSWRPGRPRRDVSVRSFLRFGTGLVGSQLVNYGTNNVDTAIVGVVHGATDLGLYNRAYQLVITPLAQVQAPVTSVAVPVLSKIQDEQARFGAYLLRGQLALGYPISLVLALVAVEAENIVALMLGEKWLAAVPLLQLFALAGIARNLAYVGYWVYVVRGLSRSLFRYSLLTGAVRVLCVAIGASFGVVGVAAGLAIAPWIAWPISLAWLSRVTTVPTRGLYAGALRIIAVAVLAGGTGFGLSLALPALPAVLEIALVGLMMLLVAAALCLLPAFRRDVRDLRDVARLVRDRRSRRSDPA
ncbi:lipopolysaccharide biosynthesis protein [Brachybacterium squillarum]|uniref:lipopolysaccharide biosynthesis protein n=1 Tax=Brachybacterium squillarum TaxID=661979 RepID=UPI0002629626|nr:lipopolysaccharide biosynthesis protein [Brachybacterium squillarum]